MVCPVCVAPPAGAWIETGHISINLIIYQNGTLYPIEIKKTTSPGKTAIKNFNVLNPVLEPEKFGELE